MITEAWNLHVVCSCGWHGMSIGGGDPRYVRMLCPDCGADRSEWHVEKCRWIDTSKWYAPWTWGNGHWESKGTVTL